MKYVVEYEVTALVFLIIIAVKFFQKQHFPNNLNKLFCIIILTAILDVSLDIISAFTISYATHMALWINYTINIIFYAIQEALPVMLMVYALMMVKKFNRRSLKLYLLLAPSLFFELLIFATPWTRLVFSVDSIRGFAHGPIIRYFYLTTLFYLGVTVFIIKKYRSRIEQDQHDTIMVFVLIIIAAIGIQYIYPKYLLTGVALAIAITMTYFTVQNPEDMLDVSSNAFNYEALQRFLKDRIENKKNFQLIAVDIEGLRRINNLFGVGTGNQVIKQVSNFLLSLDDKPWVFRMIGTRFVIITYSHEAYYRMLEMIGQRFLKPWNINQLDLLLSVKVRHFSNINFFKRTEDVINLMDLAYAKSMLNGDGVVIKEIDKELLWRMQRQFELENELREAIDSEKGFELCFQPLYSLRKKKFNSLEVLLRFRNKKLGYVSPNEFIPIAERLGMIYKLDEMVVRKTAEFVKRRDSSIENIQINLSAAEFMNQGMSEKFISIVRDWDIDPSLLIFEITETMATISYDIVSNYMRVMNEYGFRFALDDYGNGYSNISQVINLPFCMVKLDHSLLEDNLKTRNNAIIFGETIKMFRRAGMKTVVEGVETAENVERVKKLGADYIQGYYYARPMNEEELMEFLKSNNG